MISPVLRPILLALLCGCVDLHDSDRFTTAELYPSLEAEHDGRHIDVSGVFYVDDAWEERDDATFDLDTDYATLVEGDTLRATWDGREKKMRSGLFSGYRYKRRFRWEKVAEGDPVSFSLERAGHTSADKSTCHFPPSFEITAPADDDAFSRTGDDIAVSWDADPGEEDEIEVRLYSSCGDDATLTSWDKVDSWTFEAGTYFDDTYESVDDGIDPEAACEGSVQVTWTRHGQLDDAFVEGSVSCTQRRSVSFTIAP